MSSLNRDLKSTVFFIHVVIKNMLQFQACILAVRSVITSSFKQLIWYSYTSKEMSEGV